MSVGNTTKEDEELKYRVYYKINKKERRLS
jgi:hypothetical protein